jgi:hypothetical protein
VGGWVGGWVYELDCWDRGQKYWCMGWIVGIADRNTGRVSWAGRHGCLAQLMWAVGRKLAWLA